MTRLAASTQKRKLEVLTINNDKKDCDALRSIMVGHTNWIFHCVPSLSKAMQFLEKNLVPVIVCSKELLGGGTWKDVLAAGRTRPTCWSTRPRQMTDCGWKS